MEQGKLMEEFKQADEKQGRLIGLVADFHEKSSRMISLSKDVELHYSSIRDSLQQQAQEFDMQGKETEEARKKLEQEEMEFKMHVEGSLRFLDKVRDREKERVEQCEDLLVKKRTTMKCLDKKLENLRKEIHGQICQRDELCGEISLQEQKLEATVSNLESKKSELSIVELEMKGCRKDIELLKKHTVSLKDVEDRVRAVEMEAEMLKQREEQLVSREKRVAELEAKEKNKRQLQSADSLPTVEPSHSQPTDVEILAALKRSADPAGMIFRLFDNSLSRRAHQTVLIMQQLLVLSPQVSPEVKAAAIQLAVKWKGKLGQQPQYRPMDVLAFLFFLAAYGASSSYQPEDLLDLVVIVAHHETAVELCRSLGLVRFIPDLILRLCEKGKHMEAVRFSVAFNLINDFQPNKLISDHLSKARIFEDGNDLLESQYQALNNHLDSLKALPQEVARLGVDPSFVMGMISNHLGHLETVLLRKRSCLQAALATVTGDNGRATTSTNKWSWKLGGNKRLKGT